MKFAAMIPKGSYVTLCILGKKLDSEVVRNFLAKPMVKSVLPEEGTCSVQCSCLPKMNVGAPKVPFTDRIVMGGDAGSTRLFKDGLGAAYLMGKAIAKTAVFEGVGKGHFQKGYYPVYQSIIHDNLFGQILYLVIDQYRSFKVLTRAMLTTVELEQGRPNDANKILEFGAANCHNLAGRAIRFPVPGYPRHLIAGSMGISLFRQGLSARRLNSKYSF